MKEKKTLPINTKSKTTYAKTRFLLCLNHTPIMATQDTEGRKPKRFRLVSNYSLTINFSGRRFQLVRCQRALGAAKSPQYFGHARFCVVDQGKGIHAHAQPQKKSEYTGIRDGLLHTDDEMTTFKFAGF